ncbi:hypothetical protein BJF92_00660 [Rhizobium rhizosphaerae]|uniref:Uncharacterized protein n=1 Tax=Xaviernesmea rhizosphaerae TaxID=1672749 RepID=A0A1Q9AED3_9HYPH|nr:hypothetical protein BJF92_00660 [Xaviernesmea rhizosphaerae]
MTGERPPHPALMHLIETARAFAASCSDDGRSYRTGHYEGLAHGSRLLTRQEFADAAVAARSQSDLNYTYGFLRGLQHAFSVVLPRE